jgi:hypothetical protein
MTSVCQLIPFPVARRANHVNQVARAIWVRDELGAAKYLQTECRRIHASLQVLGFDHSSISSEIGSFVVAVQREIERVSAAGAA